MEDESNLTNLNIKHLNNIYDELIELKKLLALSSSGFSNLDGVIKMSNSYSMDTEIERVKFNNLKLR